MMLEKAVERKCKTCKSAFNTKCTFRMNCETCKPKKIPNRKCKRCGAPCFYKNCMTCHNTSENRGAVSKWRKDFRLRQEKRLFSDIPGISTYNLGDY